ncbi:UNVERIFIED_CONTAM: hypothetical protein GTU68_020585 [Idotea baltica]|nr:hypothetical protein [Idotea baltica]
MTEDKQKNEGSETLSAGPKSSPIPAVGRIGGIDFGTVRIGVAISDPGQSIASPLEVYQVRSPKLDAQHFQQIANQERLVGWVVGLPLHMSGDESEKSGEAREFGRVLAESTGLPVAWIDERFSTAMAREMLSQSNLSGKKRKAQLDKLAAQILLTTFLESDRSDAGPGELG